MSDMPSSYYRVKVKCLRCKLHFVLCTWYPARHRPGSLICPECGSKDAFSGGLEVVKGFIFEEVPGNSLPWDMSLPVHEKGPKT